MKQNIAIILSIILMILISGCSQADHPDESTATTTQQAQAEPVKETNEETAPQTPEAAPETAAEPSTLEPETTVEPEIVQEPEVVIPEEKRLGVPLMYTGYNDEAALCYLGAYGMAAKYADQGIDFTDIVAYSDTGTDVRYWGGGFISNGVEESGLIIASKKLGFDYVFGLGKGGKDSDYDLDEPYRMKDEAKEVVYFNDDEEALQFLKKAIAMEKPLIVHLDMYYLVDAFRSQSPCDFWKFLPKEHASHFLTVTGFDKDKIYLNDPTCQGAKDMHIAASEFLKSWEATKDMPDANLGPYWGLYLEKAGDRTSAQDVISMAKQSDAPAELRRFAEQGQIMDISCFKFNEFAESRLEFSKFLQENNNPAANAYMELSELYPTICGSSNPQQTIRTIADKEEAALGQI